MCAEDQLVLSERLRAAGGGASARAGRRVVPARVCSVRMRARAGVRLKVA